MTTKEIGDFGEKMACSYLEEQGITVLKKNFHARCGEIDMIAKDGEGATKLITSKVVGAKDEETAKIVAKSKKCAKFVGLSPHND